MLIELETFWPLVNQGKGYIKVDSGSEIALASRTNIFPCRYT